MRVKTTRRRTIGTLLERTGSAVDNKYYYLPYWFEKTDDNCFIMHSMEELPKELINLIKERRK